MTAQSNAGREAALARARQTGEALARASAVMDPRAMAMLSRSDPRRTEFEKAVAADQEAKRVVEEATRATAPPAPSPHQALATAVEKYKSAKHELHQARLAKQHGAAAVTEARAAVNGMESAVATARQNAVAHATNIASGRPGDPPMPVAQAKAMLGAAQEHFGVVEDADRGLEVRLRRAEDALAMAEIRYKRMLGEFLREAPAVFDLLRRLHEADCEQRRADRRVRGRRIGGRAWAILAREDAESRAEETIGGGVARGDCGARGRSRRGAAELNKQFELTGLRAPVPACIRRYESDRRLPCAPVEQAQGVLLGPPPFLSNSGRRRPASLRGLIRMPPAPNGPLRAPVSFSDAQLALVGAIARSVPIALRFAYLRRVAALLPEDYSDDDVRRCATRAAFQVNIAACAQAAGDRVVLGAVR
jgi:hypothetical protein